MSSEKEVRTILGEAVQAYQASTDDFDREMARLLGVNETDLRCLEILLGLEEAAPSLLATRLGLTTGSVTAMLDRLEKLDYLTRTPHPTDRRKTLVRATQRVADRARLLMAPFLEGSQQILTRYSIEQLETITDFLRDSQDSQERYTRLLRALPSSWLDNQAT